MHLIFRRAESKRASLNDSLAVREEGRPLWQTALYFALLVGILVFANWGRPANADGIWYEIFAARWEIAAILAAGLGVVLVRWYGMKAWQLLTISIPTIGLALDFTGQPLIPFVSATVGLSIVASTSEGALGDWFAAS